MKWKVRERGNFTAGREQGLSISHEGAASAVSQRAARRPVEQRSRLLSISVQSGGCVMLMLRSAVGTSCRLQRKKEQVRRSAPHLESRYKSQSFRWRLAAALVQIPAMLETDWLHFGAAEQILINRKTARESMLGGSSIVIVQCPYRSSLAPRLPRPPSSSVRIPSSSHPSPLAA